MRSIFRYIIFLFFIFLLFRFFGVILSYSIRFWYIVIPVLLLLYYSAKKKVAGKKFQNKTGLDPDKEVKLKKEPEIKVEDDEK
ncbi:MAG: hypothetical protein K8R49_08210 [Candidatus Cloacimonetes bacterium]|nr:hypothetical protein [Candidatus Cloacimonadota bacterium]